MDEHDPRFDPEATIPNWRPLQEEESLSLVELFRQKWVWYLVAGILLLPIISGCDGEYERQLRIQEWRDRFVNACLPKKGDTVTAQWVNGSLICKRITPTGRYGKTFPHAEVKVAEIGDME